MSSRPTFLQARLAGATELDDVDDWVDAWHDADGRPRGFTEELREYLGFSWFEYAAWAERPNLLLSVVALREQGRALGDAQDENAADLIAWMRSTGRLDETALARREGAVRDEGRPEGLVYRCDTSQKSHNRRE